MERKRGKQTNESIDEKEKRPTPFFLVATSRVVSVQWRKKAAIYCTTSVRVLYFLYFFLCFPVVILKVYFMISSLSWISGWILSNEGTEKRQQKKTIRKEIGPHFVFSAFVWVMYVFPIFSSDFSPSFCHLLLLVCVCVCVSVCVCFSLSSEPRHGRRTGLAITSPKLITSYRDREWKNKTKQIAASGFGKRDTNQQRRDEEKKRLGGGGGVEGGLTNGKRKQGDSVNERPVFCSC